MPNGTWPGSRFACRPALSVYGAGRAPGRNTWKTFLSRGGAIRGHSGKCLLSKLQKQNPPATPPCCGNTPRTGAGGIHGNGRNSYQGTCASLQQLKEQARCPILMLCPGEMDRVQCASKNLSTSMLASHGESASGQKCAPPAMVTRTISFVVLPGALCHFLMDQVPLVVMTRA